MPGSMTGKLVLVALVAVALQGADKIRLGLFTAMPVKWDLEANWRKFAETVEMHAREKPDLIVTPECFLDGYVASAKDWTPERFEKIVQVRDSSPYIGKVRELAKKHGTAILFGYTEKKNGEFYNAALLVERNGAFVGEYYKTRLQTHDRLYRFRQTCHF
jgi:predicted amidohydrolase